MSSVVGVYFKPNGKVYFFNRNGIDISNGSKVIVETERGLQLGTVLIEDIKNKEVLDNMSNIVRLATIEDEKNYEKFRS